MRERGRFYNRKYLFLRIDDDDFERQTNKKKKKMKYNRENLPEIYSKEQRIKRALKFL